MSPYRLQLLHGLSGLLVRRGHGNGDAVERAVQVISLTLPLQKHTRHFIILGRQIIHRGQFMQITKACLASVRSYQVTRGQMIVKALLQASFVTYKHILAQVYYKHCDISLSMR